MMDEDSLARAVANSEDLARIAPESTEYMSELGPQDYDSVEGNYASTAGLTTQARAEAAAAGINLFRTLTGKAKWIPARHCGDDRRRFCHDCDGLPSQVHLTLYERRSTSFYT